MGHPSEHPLVLLGHFLERACSSFDLIVFEQDEQFEVLALSGLEDAFPLPLDLQEGIITIAEQQGLSPTWMHATIAQVIGPSQLPSDLLHEARETCYGTALRLKMIGRSGTKYLHLFKAIHHEQDTSIEALHALRLTERESFQAMQWLRQEKLLENRHQKRLAAVLAQLSSSN